MEPGQPGDENKENNISADHLHLFGSGDGGPKGHTERTGRDVDAHKRENTEQQGPGNIKNPEGKGYLLRGQESESDECRVKIDFQFVESGKKTQFRKIFTRYHQRGNRGYGRIVKTETVQQMQQDRYGQTHQEKAVAEKSAQFVVVECFLNQQWHPQEGKIDPLVIDPLFAQKTDHAGHDKITEQDKAGPPQQGSHPCLPRNVAEDFYPVHLAPPGQAVV